jgi:hypothetical protein
MSDERREPWVDRLREEYNVPPEAPVEEMWAAIRPGLAPRSRDVVPIQEALSRRVYASRRSLGWVAAAAAALVLGIGIGRVSAPVNVPVSAPEGGVDGSLTVVREASVARAAALEHFGRSESLLTMVRADARSGGVDPDVQRWARELLAETRLLMDLPQADDAAVRALLEDLELVLAQIVGGAEASGDSSGDRSEMALALEGLENRDVLARIQAVLPAGPGLAGT